ncbi:hypothetical protein IB286_14850 [Spongiibacter sp. KMU-158]|uniref:START domain-containing protein n=1 Tax=Spongiibacter pelagi TaxID=2760804 RepID=A0A927C507_9GAMM|nr:hypothetical protein [Spongiibacter pelagi]
MKHENYGISIYTRPMPDSPIDEMRVDAVIKAPLSKVQAVLLDHEMRPLWDRLCRYAKKFEAGDSANLLELYYDFPWPLSDRDVLLRVDISQTEDHGRIEFIAENEILPLKEGVVRIHHAKTVWELYAVNDHSTQLRAEAHSEPNGPIPAWLINKLSVTQPIENIQALRTLSATSSDNGVMP